MKLFAIRYTMYLIPLYFFLTCQTQHQPQNAPNATKIVEIALPEGFKRVQVSPNSFGAYLRNLPLSTDNTVYLFNGARKQRQDVQFAVLTTDIGTRDLQQCADAVMRLRAEYLFAQKRFEDIHFNFTSGHNAAYSAWRQGERPQIKGSQVVWKNAALPDTSYTSFRKYLEVVFSYAGTISLSKEMRIVTQLNNLQIGDVFIQGGSPGHAVLVVDVAEHSQTKAKAFLLAQSYMPAQNIHILRNFQDKTLSPWYVLQDTDSSLITPEWEFDLIDLKTW